MATRIIDSEGDELEISSDGSFSTGGSVASGATDSGNPVKVGGTYNETLPTFSTGQRGDLQIGARGALHVGLSGGNQGDSTSSLLTFPNPAGTGGPLGVATMIFNGSSWDRTRGNMDVTVLSSAARTATLQSSDITNYNAKGLHLVIDVTAIAATPSVVFTIQGKDALSGKYYTILASAAITGTGTTVLKVYPGLTGVANSKADDLLPRVWRVDATHADADSITYSVGASVIL
jgi:hypothetical protein